MKTLPTRQDIMEQLCQLIAGRKTREEVSAWAVQYICSDHPRVTDTVGWEALKTLGGADIRADLDHYLYDEADFKKWMEELSL